MKEQVYNPRGVHSVKTGIFLNRYVTEKMSIGISANYWNQLQSSISSSLEVKERYFGYGLGLSIKHMIN